MEEHNYNIVLKRIYFYLYCLIMVNFEYSQGFDYSHIPNGDKYTDELVTLLKENNCKVTEHQFKNLLKVRKR